MLDHNIVAIIISDGVIAVMLFTVRQRKIFELLWMIRDYVTVKDIADEVSYSEKTVRSDLDVIRNEVVNHNIGRLVAKTNKGFFLEMEKTAYEKIATTFVENKIDERIKNRMCRMLMMLLVQPEVSAQELADCVYLDKGAIKKYLLEVESWLLPFGIELFKSSAVYSLSCTEVIRRKLFWYLFIELKLCQKKESAKHLYSSAHIPNKKYFDDADYFTLKIMFAKEMHYFELIMKAIEELEKKYNISYTYDSCVWLIFSLVLVIHRRKMVGDRLVAAASEAMETCPEREMAHYLCLQLHASTGLIFSDDDVQYTTLVLLTSELNDVNDESIRGQLCASPLHLGETIQEFILSLSHVVSHGLLRDKQLLWRLILLIRPMIYRNLFGMNRAETGASQSLIRQVKFSYLDLYLEVELCSLLYEQRYSLTLNEQEISLITLCIKNAQSLALKKIRVAIICNYGIGISQFVAQKIQRAITQVEIVGIFSLRELDQLDNNYCDLVVSTVPLQRSKETVIQVNDVLLPYDLSLIKETVKKMQKNKMLQTLQKKTDGRIKSYHQYIFPEMIFVISKVKNSNAVLEFICHQATTSGCCDEKYLSSVLEREKASSTEIASGVVLTHGDPSLVKANFISLAILREPIDWGGEQNVDVVFMVGFKRAPDGKIDGNIAGFYTMLAGMVENDEIMKYLRDCISEQELYRFLIDESKYEDVI
ncbi:PTS sugar transporter subunit IIA [Klebsiella indica]|uniref:BglG family transcription antiterminator n=1 Tax=Klebsiella TaxID=570 RepID=UPI0031B7084C